MLSELLVSNHVSEWWQPLSPYNGTLFIRQPVALRWWNMVLQLSVNLFLNHHLWLIFLFWQYILFHLTFCLGWKVNMNNNISIWESLTHTIQSWLLFKCALLSMGKSSFCFQSLLKLRRPCNYAQYLVKTVLSKIFRTIENV